MGTWRKYTAELLQRVQTGGQGLEISVWPLLEAPPSGMTAAGDGVEPCVTIA
jgi:hypothetical protein